MQGTDNSLLEAKISIRLKNLPSGQVTVLDAFGGHGVVWKEVIARSKREDISRIGIDKEIRPSSLKGDNLKYLRGLDLSRFNVIDLDAYGIPFAQADLLFRRQFSGIVFFTFIQSVMGMIPWRLASTGGITKGMYEACPTLIGSLGWEIWKYWLATNGIKRLAWMESKGTTDRARKHYGVFRMQ